MAAFLVADIKITDDAWIPGYVSKVTEIVERHGGRYLSRSANIRTIEGEALDTTVLAILQFPSTEAAEAFANDPDYAPLARARQGGSVSRFHLVDDTDVAGVIPYLPKA